MNRESLVVTKVADLLLTAFDKIESGLKSMNDFFGGATNTLKFFGIALAALLAPAALGGLITAFGAIFSVGGAVVAGLLLIGLALEDVYQYMTGGESVLGDFIKAIQNGSEEAKIFASIIIGVIVGIAARMIWLGVISAVTWGANAAGAIRSFAIASAASLASFLSMSRRFIAIGVLAGAIYLQMAAAAVSSWAIAGASALAAGAKMALAWIIGLGPIGLLIAGIALVVAAFGTAAYFIYKNWESIKEFASNAINYIGDTISSLGSIFKDIFYDTPIKWISEMVDFAIEKIKSIGQSISGFVGIDTNVAPSVNPSSVASSATGGAGTTIDNRQTVNVTVPQGTPEAQQNFLKQAAAQSFGDTQEMKIARRMGAITP